MSADTRPIPPSRFAAALKDLSPGMLHLKVLEIRNSIAHLEFSNDQLKPFADGSATALDPPRAARGEPDQDCVDAIRENEAVIARMVERIALIRAEVEERGISWTEFQSRDEAEAKAAANGDAADGVNGEPGNEADEGRHDEGRHDEGRHDEGRHAAWTDGIFQTGTIRDGEVHLHSRPGQPDADQGSRTAGGSLSDEQLRQAVEEQLRNLDDDGGGSGGGMHL